MELVNVMKLIMDTAKPKYAFVEKINVMALICNHFTFQYFMKCRIIPLKKPFNSCDEDEIATYFGELND